MNKYLPISVLTISMICIVISGFMGVPWPAVMIPVAIIMIFVFWEVADILKQRSHNE